jgi:hypothetical protein
MNSTPAEFRRTLVQAFGDAVVDDDSGLLLSADDVVLHYALTPGTARTVGAIRIPLLRVEISVRQGNETSAAALQARVDRATQRGGG